MAHMRIALFVEGAEYPAPVRGRDPLEVIWNTHLCHAAGVQRFHPIVRISKKHLVAMDCRQPRMSGASEPLDQLLARKLRETPFDAALVAWDLYPQWNPDGSYCRWHEICDLYRFLARSRALPTLWRQQACNRLAELGRRKRTGALPHVHCWQKGLVLALCMEPMFEALLVGDEGGVRRALGLSGSPRGWPAPWNAASERQPDMRLLAPAIRCAYTAFPRPAPLRQVRGDMHTNKHAWCEYLLRRLLADSRSRAILQVHPIWQRLVHLRTPS